MNGQNRSDIEIDALVDIVLKKGQASGALTRGHVKRILTKSANHFHGAKVMLREGDQVGRVKALGRSRRNYYKMISYEPFYKTLLDKDITEYQFIFKHEFSANIMHRMKHGKNITLKTLDALCFILKCNIEDVSLNPPYKRYG